MPKDVAVSTKNLKIKKIYLMKWQHLIQYFVQLCITIFNNCQLRKINQCTMLPAIPFHFFLWFHLLGKCGKVNPIFVATLYMLLQNYIIYNLTMYSTEFINF
jgi:hypothetical protein